MNLPAPPKMAYAKGLSMIELMIALLIGSILMLGLIQVFAASRTAYQVSEGMSRVQENARFALDYLQRDARMIGHFGCVNDQSHKLQVDAFRMQTGAATGAPLDFNLSVQGFEATGTAPGSDVNLAGPAGGWSPALPPHLTALNPLPGSDVIMLRFLRPNSAPVTDITFAGSTANVVTTAGGWKDLTQDGVAAPDVFGLADCSFADVFIGAGNAGTATVTATPVKPLDRYTPSPAGHAALYRAEAVAYYVANGAGGRPSLWRARWNAAGVAQREELVEGIENLQLLFGQDQSADAANPSGYIGNQVTAATIGAATSAAGEQAWRRVGLVQIGIVAASPDVASSPQASNDATKPRALGVRFTAPADARFRSSYETTVALRNRLYGN